MQDISVPRTFRKNVVHYFDGVGAPSDGVAICNDNHSVVSAGKATSMDEVTIVGVDPAMQVIQVHGPAADGRALFRNKPSRAQFTRVMASLAPCVAAMEACGTAPAGVGSCRGTDMTSGRPPGLRENRS